MPVNGNAHGKSVFLRFLFEGAGQLTAPVEPQPVTDILHDASRRLLMPERQNGQHLRRFAGRIKAEHHADHNGEAQRDHGD